MDKRLLIEIAVGIVVFVLGTMLGKHTKEGKRKSRGRYEFGGMELVGVCGGDNPSPPQNEGVYRLELYCKGCKLWNMYEGEELTSIHGNIQLGCCSSKTQVAEGTKRRVNISGDRRAYFVSSAVQVFKQFNNEEK